MLSPRSVWNNKLGQLNEDTITVGTQHPERRGIIAYTAISSDDATLLQSQNMWA
jgi:hypothetical protein